MGPRLGKRGNTENNFLAASWFGLQWGHAWVSVEIDFLLLQTPHMDMLQWGHAWVSVEIAGYYSACRASGCHAIRERWLRRLGLPLMLRLCPEV